MPRQVFLLSLLPVFSGAQDSTYHRIGDYQCRDKNLEKLPHQFNFYPGSPVTSTNCRNYCTSHPRCVGYWAGVWNTDPDGIPDPESPVRGKCQLYFKPSAPFTSSVLENEFSAPSSTGIITQTATGEQTWILSDDTDTNAKIDGCLIKKIDCQFDTVASCDDTCFEKYDYLIQLEAQGGGTCDLPPEDPCGSFSTQNLCKWCADGEGACKYSDCEITYSACNENCKSIPNIISDAIGPNAVQCPEPSACETGQGSCVWQQCDPSWYSFCDPISCTKYLLPEFSSSAPLFPDSSIACKVSLPCEPAQCGGPDCSQYMVPGSSPMECIPNLDPTLSTCITATECQCLEPSRNALTSVGCNDAFSAYMDQCCGPPTPPAPSSDAPTDAPIPPTPGAPSSDAPTDAPISPTPPAQSTDAPTDAPTVLPTCSSAQSPCNCVEFNRDGYLEAGIAGADYCAKGDHCYIRDTCIDGDETGCTLCNPAISPTPPAQSSDAPTDAPISPTPPAQSTDAPTDAPTVLPTCSSAQSPCNCVEFNRDGYLEAGIAGADYCAKGDHCYIRDTCIDGDETRCTLCNPAISPTPPAQSTDAPTDSPASEQTQRVSSSRSKYHGFSIVLALVFNIVMIITLMKPRAGGWAKSSSLE